ncbi:peptidoglycan-binding protein [Echinicola pacifica]|uniref:Peptidoglycan-binding protein n=1 Tax=Echinicola pacifica TaxID=346377 RepID=A0A918UKX8_9BACT|nr:N-acetylmuramidase family protein [Echinicola pacifica]GGZ17405.1 peptidoglycan-binding protein [Echinicola pacifica]
MRMIKYRSRGPEVRLLEEILQKMGYDLYVSDYFGKDTHEAIMDFQRKNSLVVDGIVGIKSWSKLLALNPDILNENSKLLSERDLEDFATKYGLEIATVKAVNEVESRGKGFLVDGRAKILFEGHVFWKQLKSRGVDPNAHFNQQTSDILYPEWTRSHYKGGAGEYDRLQKARDISPGQTFSDAANSSASWGSFQIMGYHAKTLGYSSVDDFVSKMQLHEREHLDAFGRFLEVNQLIRLLKDKNWQGFAKRYNGPLYARNKYDERLQKAYDRYLNV